MIQSGCRRVGRPPRAFAFGEDSPLLQADWINTLFTHFAVDADALEPIVPFELDLHDGTAYVSLVAFTQDHLRPQRGGQIASTLFNPIARHEFLNLRTYVRFGRECGIFFLAEWIPNRLAVVLGPAVYGLPYRFGRMRYYNRLPDGRMDYQVRAREGMFHCMSKPRLGSFAPAEPGSLDHFLLERYVAFTRSHGRRLRFQVDHDPWPQQRVEVDLIDMSIVSSHSGWYATARFAGANYSPGVHDVIIAAPTLMPRSETSPCLAGR